MSAAIEANRRLATLLGWTDIIEVGGALLGMPPPGDYSCRNQAKVPDWAGDWRECGLLMSRYQIHTSQQADLVTAVEDLLLLRATIKLRDESERDRLTRMVIVLATIRRLECNA